MEALTREDVRDLVVRLRAAEARLTDFFYATDGTVGTSQHVTDALLAVTKARESLEASL